MKVLIVDDKQLPIHYLADILNDIDSSIEWDGANSAEEALELAKQTPYDVAFLDIEMPGTNGIELAAQLALLRPKTNLIFVTGHANYALDAYEVYPSAYLLKPTTEEDVREALANLRHPVKPETRKGLYVQCFGNFEVFNNGVPLHFDRSKAKELLAYLIDRRGASAGIDELLSVLWEDAADNSSQRAQLRTVIASLKSALDSVGAGNIINRRRTQAKRAALRAEAPASWNSVHGQVRRKLLF